MTASLRGSRPATRRFAKMRQRSISLATLLISSRRWHCLVLPSNASHMKTFLARPKGKALWWLARASSLAFPGDAQWRASRFPSSYFSFIARTQSEAAKVRFPFLFPSAQLTKRWPELRARKLAYRATLRCGATRASRSCSGTRASARCPSTLWTSETRLYHNHVTYRLCCSRTAFTLT